MSNQSFERQLRQINPPAPDPAARVRARRVAVAEFRRLNPQKARKPAGSWWLLPRPWLAGFATACVAIVGISLFRMTPQQERVLAPQQNLPAIPPASESQLAAPPPSATEPGVVLQERAATEGRPAAPATLAATAQDAELFDVQVTGTRLLSPGTTVAREQMNRLGITNVGDALTQLVPQNVSTYMPSLSGDSSDHQASGGGSQLIESGAFFIGNTIAELRGVDPAFGSRTLTLVDGRRHVSVNDMTLPVDLNIIPSNLLERMDVVTGTGATAGGVNARQQQARALSEAQDSGTRVLAANAASVSPVNAITADEISRLGIVNVADALTQLVPQNISAYMPGLVGEATVASGDRFGQFAINPVKRTVDEPESTFSSDVDTSSYSFVRRELNAGVLPPGNAVRTEEMLNYFDYDWPAAESRDQPFRPTVTVSDSPWSEGRKLVHIGIKGYELPAKDRPNVNLVLLLDVSGSMNSPDRLPLAQRSMALLLDSLRPTDTVGIAVYAGAAGEVLPPTPVKNKDAILQALNALRPGGSTAGVAGIRVAYDMAARGFRKDGVNRILLATDGDFNVGISDPDELQRFVEQQRDRGINLSVLGFGVGNYRDDIAQALAQNGNGVAAYIDSVNEARKVLVQQAGSQLFTIARDVKFQVEFNPATVAEYRLVGYETRALAREDFSNDKVDAGDVGAGHTVTAIYEITPVGTQGRQLDERRYRGNEKPAPAPVEDNMDEYGFLKIRYKLPDSGTSQLITQPIGVQAGVPRALRQDVQFATAVAGFAQLLQGGGHSGPVGFDEIYRQAQGALGEDPYGYRAEFLQLVRRAQAMTRK